MKTILALATVLATGFVLLARPAECVSESVQRTIDNTKKMLEKDGEAFDKIESLIAGATSCYDAFSRHMAYEELVKLRSDRRDKLNELLDSNRKVFPKRLVENLQKAHNNVMRNKVAPIIKLLEDSCKDKESMSGGRAKINDAIERLKKFAARKFPTSVRTKNYSYDDDSDDGGDVERNDGYDEDLSVWDEYDHNVQVVVQDERMALDEDKRQFEDIGTTQGLERAFEEFEKDRRAEIERVLDSYNALETVPDAKIMNFRKDLHAAHQKFFLAHKNLLAAIEGEGRDYNIIFRNRLTTYLFERKRAVVKGRLWMKYKKDGEYTSDFTSYSDVWSL